LSRTHTKGNGPVRPEIVAEEAQVAVGALRFLSDPNRVRIIKCLSNEPACVFELTEFLNVRQPLVSYHLKRLREAGLVRSQRRAHRVYYEVDRTAWDTFTQPIRDLCAIVEVISDETAQRSDAPGQ
jgi:DNA-binding transcriptional ArsR family regulator